MNEAETRAELIGPLCGRRDGAWSTAAASVVRSICAGRLEARDGAKPEIADYVLTFRNHKLAIIEAKPHDSRDTEGVGQAKAYAEKLQGALCFLH